MRHLALLLLISLLNLIAAPFLPASRSAAAPLNAPDGPTDFIRRIDLTTNDLAYSSTTGRIYASLPSFAGSTGNSIAAIDPTTGLITSTTFVGSEPNKLALSDDGHSLYVTLDGAAAIRRFDALTNTPGLQFSLGEDQVRGRYSVSDFAVAPANPGTLAVARQFSGVSPSEAGVAIFDDGVQRPKVGPGHLDGADFVEFSATASKLYGNNPSGGIQTLTIDATGVSLTSTVLPNVSGDIKFSNGRIYTSFGQVVNPDTSTLLGTFASAFAQTFVPDPANGRAYYLQFGPTDGTLTLKVFDINTFLPLGSLEISGAVGMPTSLLRWGPNGLAFRTNLNQLFIIQTSLIPSAEPIPTPTPTPSASPTPFPFPSPVPAFIRQVTLSANDLVYNQGTQKIYASVASNEGSTGNSIAEIDPVAGAVTNKTFVGSEPNLLAPADDGSTLYVGLDGAASIRRYDMVTHTAGQQFFVGRDSFFGTYGFSDIAVSPGNPSTIAVARQHPGVSPSQAGVAIFDNGVQRPTTGPGHGDGSDILAFASPSLLYGAGFNNKLSKMSIDSSGVTVTGTTSFFAGNSMVLANNLIYGASGQVIDPSTGALVGTFFGAFTGVSSNYHVIDVANNRAFYLINQFNFDFGLSAVIIAYDLNTFLQVGFIHIGGVPGGANNLIRWGTNGLAFRTSDRKVYLIESPLVNSSVPIPSPTPTPSPTPSPTPTYIPTFLRRVDLPANSVVYSEATQALYATVPSTAGANGNSITKITTGTGEVGPPVFVGSEPNRMAISSDGGTIWTHLNGANAVRRFDVLTGSAGLQFNTGAPQPPADMEVVPGSPQSLVLSRGLSGGLAVFDNGVQRPSVANLFGPIEFGADASTLYGSSGGTLTKFLVDANGITESKVTGGFWPDANAFEFSDGLVFSSRGIVADPESGEWKGTFAGGSFFTVMAVDGPNKRTFFAFRNGVNVILGAFDSNTFTPIGGVTLPEIGGDPVSLIRWGTNGLAFATVPTTFPGASRVYLVQTELVSKAAPIPTGIQFETDRLFVREGTPTISVKVARTGDVSGTASIDFATSDGNATAGSDYIAVSGTLTFVPGELSKNISIPIIDDNLFETGDETFKLTLSNPTGGAFLTAPKEGTINLSDNEFQPFVSMSPTLSIVEGDSGTQNIAVNVTLSGLSIQAVTVNYATSNGTATAGSDYVAASGTLTIPAGSTSATVNIPINGDTAIEANETFTLTLSNQTNAAFISNPVATVTIVNDDATVQFNNAAFSVNEGAGFATVTVTRAGDTSRAATVLFSTTDTAGLQTCSLANGKASERCDYGTAVGRLDFAIGQTSRTFTIPIVDDAIVEGDETLTVNLTGPAGALLGATGTATVTITDNDTTPATQNPVDGVTFFITQQYIDFLGRLPDAIGLANWTNTLGNCPNNGFGEFDNPTCDRVHVSAGFSLSDEFRARGFFAYKFYEVGFDRRPAYTEFVPDMALVGGPQSPQSEEISKTAYTDAFAQRQEFRNRYDALSNSAYVDALETNAEVTLANKAALVAALNANQKTRAQVLREIVELQSVTDKFFIRAFVAMQYFGYLRRDPDAIGYDNWVNTLTADPSNVRHMIFGFIYSDEYRHRFGP
ncbi:MAG TPA: Calx-beta domain-containing protein [Pyrinomonadaceae bacterium]|nr:Calx-beta domain-containing protein [Pyrinomonadaceae bacterium]